MSEAGQHENVRLLTYAELEEVTGSVGNFKVKIRQKARQVDYDLCTGCGVCVEKCPRKVFDTEFEAGMGNRKAIYMPFPQAVPRIPVMDTESCIWFERQKCGACQKLCPTNAIRFDQEDEMIEVNVGNIILATGLEAVRLHEDSAVRLRATGQRLHEPGVRAAVQRGRPDQRQDRVARRQDEPKSVAIIHCVGSRDMKHNPYCSGVCCMASLKFGAPGHGEDRRPGVLVLHRHAHEPEGLRRVLSAAAGRRRAVRARQGLGSDRCGARTERDAARRSCSARTR